MVIDFHTHTFPDRIAEKTIPVLEKKAGIKSFTDGTLNGLKKSMEGCVDISVILPVLTKPSQSASVNRSAAEINEGEHSLLSFGGIHPDTSDYRTELRRIQELGLKGIKLHPAYQQTYIDDLSYMRIVDYASGLGMIVSIHAGVDIGIPKPLYCTPVRTLELIRKVKPDRLVLAHMGGWKLWDEVEEYLAGENVYFDTSFTNGYMDEQQMMSIIEKHGAGKILFGTDSPWGGQRESLEAFCRLPLSEAEKADILCNNALRLLQMEKFSS